MGWDEWTRTVEIEPSLYAADFSCLQDQIDVLLRAGARVFHFDVGDGHFIRPITVGPVVLRSIAPRIHAQGGVLDCHLMVARPEHHFTELAESGADSVTFHFEACDDLPTMLAQAREHGLQAGLAFNPESDVEAVAAEAEGFDLVLCMSIHPGYSGQTLLDGSLERIARLRSLLPDGIRVQVDGGVNHDNARAVHEAGADLMVCGSAIFGMEDLPRAYRRLVQALA